MRLLIDMSFVKQPGGAMTSLEDLIRFINVWNRSNVELGLIVGLKGFADNHNIRNKCNIYEVPSKNIFDRALFYKIKFNKIIQDFSPDYIVFAGGIPPTDVRVPYAMMLRQALYFCKDVHLPIEFKLELYIKKKLTLKYIKKADYVFVQTKVMQDDIKQLLGNTANTVKIDTIIWNVLSDQEVKLTNEKLKNNYSNDNNIILFYPTVALPHKNNLKLIEAMALIKEKIPNAKLCLTLPSQNQPPFGSKNELKKIYKYIEKLKLTENIELLGTLSHQQTLKVYASSYIFVFPSLCESFGVPLLEAMAAGLPIVASNIPVIREVTDNCGMYFDPSSPLDIAGKIIDAFKRVPYLSQVSFETYMNKYYGKSIWEQVLTTIQK